MTEMLGGGEHDLVDRVQLRVAWGGGGVWEEEWVEEGEEIGRENTPPSTYIYLSLSPKHTHTHTCEGWEANHQPTRK